MRADERKAITAVLTAEYDTPEAMAADVFNVCYRLIQARETYGVAARTSAGTVWSFAPYLTKREAAKAASVLAGGGLEVGVATIRPASVECSTTDDPPQRKVVEP